MKRHQPSQGPTTGTPQERTGKGMGQAMETAFPPDAAADDVLDGLIDQLRGLNWSRTQPEQSKGPEA